MTSNVALASYLFALGNTLHDVDRTNSRSINSIFELTSESAELIKGWQEEASVNALAFYNSYQTLKRRLYNQNA